MGDASWDNGGMAAPRRKGMPLWGKILAGCGVALLLLLATCVGGGIWVYKKSSSRISAAWSEMARDVESLRTDEGARSLYRANPGLAQNYATEDEFVKASGEWRDRLGSLPATPPSLKELAEGKGQGSFAIHSENDHRRVRFRFKKGGTLILEWEQDQLVDIRME